MVKLTISIPAYNDAESIERVIEESFQAAQQVTSDFEVFVINDGSKDDTSQRIHAMTTRFPKLKIHEHPINLGFGATIRECYTMPDSEWIYFIPGDGQVPADGVVELFRSTPRADFILAYRRDRRDTLMRWIVSRFYNFLVSLVAGRRVLDVNAAGLLKSAALEGIELCSKSAFIHAELMLEVLRHGGRVVEVPFTHRPREHGEASGNKWRVILACVREFAAYVLDRRLGIKVWGGDSHVPHRQVPQAHR